MTARHLRRHPSANGPRTDRPYRAAQHRGGRCRHQPFMLIVRRLRAGRCSRRRSPTLCVSRYSRSGVAELEHLLPRQRGAAVSRRQITATHHLRYRARVHTQQFGRLTLRDPPGHERKASPDRGIRQQGPDCARPSLSVAVTTRTGRIRGIPNEPHLYPTSTELGTIAGRRICPAPSGEWTAASTGGPSERLPVSGRCLWITSYPRRDRRNVFGVERVRVDRSGSVSAPRCVETLGRNGTAMLDAAKFVGDARQWREGAGRRTCLALARPTD